MSLGIIGGVIVFGFIILVLTGQGILTKAVFEISDIPGVKINSAGKDENALIALDKGFAIANPTISADQIKQIKDAYPTIAIASTIMGENTGKQINLSGANLAVAKIALLTFWIIIAIMLFGFKFIF
jgi:hypothetical protein